jgi:hypothetical protein
MKKLILATLFLSAFSLNVHAGSHVKKSDVTKADYLKQAEARFDRMDADKNGILTVAEKKAYWAKIKAEREAKKEAKKTEKK